MLTDNMDRELGNKLDCVNTTFLQEYNNWSSPTTTSSMIYLLWSLKQLEK
jgi:hypothetical protein